MSAFLSFKITIMRGDPWCGFDHFWYAWLRQFLRVFRSVEWRTVSNPPSVLLEWWQYFKKAWFNCWRNQIQQSILVWLFSEGGMMRIIWRTRLFLVRSRNFLPLISQVDWLPSSFLCRSRMTSLLPALPRKRSLGWSKYRAPNWWSLLAKFRPKS